MQADAISADSPMAAVLDALPGARRALFAKYHLGGCQSCAFSNEETLAQLAGRAGLDVDEVLHHLLTSHQHDQLMWIDPKDVCLGDSSDRLIDLRTREEHEAVSIPGSEFFTQDLQQQLFAEQSPRRIVLYDHTGKSVLDQVAWFRGHGLDQTFGLRGGIDAWSREMDPSLPRYRLEFDD